MTWIMKYDMYGTGYERTLEARGTDEARKEVLEFLETQHEQDLAEIGVVQVIDVRAHFQVSTQEVVVKRYNDRVEQDQEKEERAELARLLAKYGAAKDE